MSSALKQLEQMHLEKLQARSPHFPMDYIKKPKFNPNTANGLTDCIVKWIKYKGGMATRINSTGVYDKKLGDYRHSNTLKGFADTHGLLNGKALYIEIKIGADKQSEIQKEFEQAVTVNGGYYFIAKDLESFVEWFNSVFERNGGNNV